MSDVITITPGAGSFTDPFGNVFTIDAANNDTADINGQPITPNGESSLTGALELDNGSVYGQDETTGQWYLLASKGTPGLWEWQPVSAPPDSTTVGSSDNFVLAPGGATTPALGNDQTSMVFVGNAGTDVTAASSDSTDSSQATSGVVTPDDFQQSSGNSFSTDNSQGPLPSTTPDGTGGTTLAFGTPDYTGLQGMTAIPTCQVS